MDWSEREVEEGGERDVGSSPGSAGELWTGAVLSARVERPSAVGPELLNTTYCS